MAKAIIPFGKKRYSILLTQTNYEWLHSFIIKTCKQPRSQVAVVIDEMVYEMKEAISPMLEACQKSGKAPTMSDFMIMLGQTLQKFGNEQSELDLK
jgi:hypothetical protein